MKFYLRLGLILLAFCIVATALLAYINSVTKPRIDNLKRVEAEEARAALIPHAKFSEVVINPGQNDSLVYYVATAETDSTQILGYTFTAAKYGYSSNVKTMAAVDKDFKIMNIKVVEQSETPGLGANCSAPNFGDRFRGFAADLLKVDKDGGQIQSMTGATITTRAVTNSLKEAIALVRKDVEARNSKPTEVTS